MAVNPLVIQTRFMRVDGEAVGDEEIVQEIVEHPRRRICHGSYCISACYGRSKSSCLCTLSLLFLFLFFSFFHFNYLLLTHMHMHVLMSYAPCSMPSRPGCVHRNHTAVSVVPTLVTFMHTQHKKNKKIDLRHTGCVASVNTFRPIDRRHTIHRESRHIS